MCIYSILDIKTSINPLKSTAYINWHRKKYNIWVPIYLVKKIKFLNRSPSTRKTPGPHILYNTYIYVLFIYIYICCIYTHTHKAHSVSCLLIKPRKKLHIVYLERYPNHKPVSNNPSSSPDFYLYYIKLLRVQVCEILSASMSPHMLFLLLGRLSEPPLTPSLAGNGKILYLSCC